jgi:hypothetical protein
MGPRKVDRATQELKLVFLGLTMALPFLLHRAVPLLQWHRTELGVEPGNDIPIELRHGSEETALSYSASEALTKLTTLRGEAVGGDLMSISMVHGATGLGDLIDMGGHRQGDQPILEFARHFRNACAHGDRWHFRNKGAQASGCMPEI